MAMSNCENWITVIERADFNCQNNLAPAFLVGHLHMITTNQNHNCNNIKNTYGEIKSTELSNNQPMRTFIYTGANL